MIPYLLMSRIYGLPVGIFMLIASSLPSATSSNKWVLDNDFENNQDTSELLWEKNGISLLTCGSLCDRNQSCLSFIYHPSLMKCVGSQSYKRGLPAGQAMQQEWKYYTKPQHCDGDYVYIQTLGLCYKVHSTPKNRWDAMAVCETEGAKLIIIRNDMELQHIYNSAVRDAQFFSKWIGLRAMGADRQWKWWNGNAASSIPWNPGQPDIANGNETCVFIYNGRFWDSDCHILYGFLCRRDT